MFIWEYILQRDDILQRHDNGYVAYRKLNFILSTLHRENYVHRKIQECTFSTNRTLSSLQSIIFHECDSYKNMSLFMIIPSPECVPDTKVVNRIEHKTY